MNTIYLSTQRIIKFSKHLSDLNVEHRKGEFTEVSLYAYAGGKYRIKYEINIPAYITEELSKVFPENWQFNKERNEYALLGIPDYAPAEAGIGGFFELTEEEFLHCFSILGKLPGIHFPHVYGGGKLTESSGPHDIARNLSDLAAFRMQRVNLN